MGNKQVRIGLRVDETSYEAGSVVTGRVYLSVSRQDQRAEAVHLLLVGEEFATIAHQERDADQHSSRHNVRNHYHMEVERATSSIVHMEVPLAHFPSTVLIPGQYEYPFEWELPSTLPSSMHCAQGESHCEIRYHLTAFLYVSGSSFTPQYSSTQAISISARPPLQVETNTGIFMEPEEFRISSCCSNKGRMTLGWDTDTAVASPQSPVQVGIFGSNESLVPVNFLRARWTETVSWTAHGRTEEISRVLAEQKVATLELDHWHPVEYVNGRRPGLPHAYQVAGENESRQGRIVTRLNIPYDARDTHRGSLVQVRHALVVTAMTPGGCCVTTPESSALVQVQRKSALAPSSYSGVVHATPMYSMAEPTLVEANVLPDDWSPQQAEVVSLSLTTAVAMDSSYAPRTQPFASAPDESLLKESHSIATALSKLLTLLSCSDDPVETLVASLDDPLMVATVHNLSPHEFVEVVKASRQDQPQVARYLASTMDTHFQCRHVLACLWALPHQVRLDVMREVAPLASDLSTQRNAVEQELDGNELAHFRAALR